MNLITHPHVTFKCRKCGHETYVNKMQPEKIYSMDTYECPACGEEGYENWLYAGEGNFEERL